MMIATVSAEPHRLKLYQLPGAFHALEQAIDDLDGELTPDLERTLDGLEMALEDKADGVASLIAQASAEVAFFDAELSRLNARKAIATGRAAALKAYLHRTLIDLGRDRVEGRRFKVRVQRNSAPAIVWTRGDDAIPEGFRRVTVAVDGEAAREAWKAGVLPEGFDARLGSHVRIS